MKLGIGLSLANKRFVGGFDPAYKAVLDFQTSENMQLASDRVKILQNNVVLGFKDKGLWNKKDAFGLFATDGDVDSALVCWKRLIKMKAISSPTFTPKGGIDGNGSSSYIDTLFRPAIDGVNFLQDDAGLSINVGSGEGYIVGNSSTASGNQRMRIGGADFMINGSVTNLNPSFEIGNIHLDRLSSTEVVSQQDSTITNTRTNSSAALQNNEIFLLRITNNYSDANIKSFSARASFTEQEKNDYNTIINTYLAAL